MGKGSRTRQGANIKKFNENYDAIFNKDMRFCKICKTNFKGKHSIADCAIAINETYCEVCETHYTGRHDRDDCIMALNNKEDMNGK